MTHDTTSNAAKFLQLHRTGFVMANAWDAGTAILLAHEGFLALGTTSAGIAFSLGKPDHDSRNATLTPCTAGARADSVEGATSPRLPTLRPTCRRR